MLRNMAKKKATRRRGGRTPGKWTLLTKDQLRSFRKDAGMSRSRLAERLGVSSTSIQNWETERSVPLTRYQEQLVQLMKGGTPVATGSGRGAKTRPANGRATNGASAGAGGTALQETGLTATTEILKGFLATPQGAKISKDELVALASSLRTALSS